MKKETVQVSYIYNLIYQILNVLLPLATTPYISRVIGSEGIGVYSFTYSLVSVFVMVGSLGIGTYGQREIAAVNETPLEYTRRFWEIQIVKSVSITISMVGFVIMALFSTQYTIFFLIQLPYFVGAVLDISWFFQGMEQFRQVAIRNILIKIVSLAAIFIFVKNRADLMIYMVILCVSQVIGNLAMWGPMKKNLVSLKGERLCAGRHVKSVFVYIIPTISYQIYAVLDKTMLGVITDNASENGYYEQAHKLINIATAFVSSYTIVMCSKMTVLFAKKDYDSIHAHFEQSLRFILLLVYPMSWGLWAIAGNLVPWFFGDGYEPVVKLLRVFSSYFVFMGVCYGISTHILTPSGQQGKGNVGQCIAAIANVIMNLILIPKWGAVGAAIASVISEAFIVIAYMHYVPDYLTYRRLILMSLKYFSAAFVMGGAVWLVAERLQPTPVNTFVCIIGGVIVYVIALFVMKEPILIDNLKRFQNKFKRNNSIQ